MQPVLGLVPHDRLRAVDHLGGSFFAARIISASTCQAWKSRRRSSFSDSKPIEVQTSVVTRSAPRTASMGSAKVSQFLVVLSDSTSYPGGVEMFNLKSNSAAACSQVLQTLFESPIQATVAPRIGPRWSM